ncbi:MAG: HEAT repeat domain-containing protein [Pseudomonadota bacterium]
MSQNPASTTPVVSGQPPARLDLVRYFCAAFAKAVRSYSMYSRNNEALEKFMSAAYRYIEQSFTENGDLEFNVRRDRLAMLGEDVLVDPDRETGIPFRLFREGIRRVTLEAGMDRAELDKLIEILSKPPVQADLDDDMVCMLWRAGLPHFRYVTLDIYDAGSSADDDDEDDSTPQREEIRQDLDRLLSAIYSGNQGTEESVKAVNISGDDLVALATLGEDRQRETERIGTSTSRAIFNVGEEVVAKLLGEVAAETDFSLLDLTFEVLLGVLFQVRTSAESQQVIQELVSLYDAILVERDYKSAASLIRQMASYSDGQDLKNVAIVKQLFRLFSSTQRLAQIAVALNDNAISSTAQLAELMHLLGPDVVPGLLANMAAVQQPQHRRVLCDLMLEISPPTVEQLRGYYGKAEWFVDRDLLYMASRINEPAAYKLLIEGCHHAHARVRQQALGMLQHAPRGEADEELAFALDDAEQAVRITVVRTLVSRRTPGVADQLKKLIADPGFLQRDSSEQRTFLVAFGALAGPGAVTVLEQILQGSFQKGSGLLDRVRVAMETISEEEEELRCSAAVALSAIGGTAAVDALRRGTSVRHRKVKDVCQRAVALAETPRKSQPKGATDAPPGKDDGGQGGAA